MPTLDADISSKNVRTFRLGIIELNEGTRELRVSGEVTAIEKRPFDLLQVLLERAPNVVTKDELMSAVWHNRVVDESSLTTAIRAMRLRLGVDNQDLVKTVHGIGYRIAEVPETSAADIGPGPSLHKPGEPITRRPQWRLERPLSAASEVWLACHEKTNERRVFKFARTAERLGELKREVALSRILQDALGARTDIVPILEWNFEENPYFIEMPFGGDDLAAWTAAQGGLAAIPLRSRLDMVVRVARTIADAHGAGVLHGDVKPANLLLQGDVTPHIRIADFGAGGLTEASRREALSHTLQAATLPADATRTGSWMYAAPEILHGGPPSIKADVYALGILLYQIYARALDKPLAAGWENDIPDLLVRQDIAKAAEGDPVRRMEFAADLAERLARLEDRRAEQSRRDAEASAAARLARQVELSRLRRPWLIAVIACLISGFLAVGIAGLGAMTARDEARRQAATATAVNLFLTKDLLGCANPRVSGKPDETLLEAIAHSEQEIAKRFDKMPMAEASVYVALALAYNNLHAVPQARAAYDHAASAYVRAEGEFSADAAIAWLRRASMEAYETTPKAIATAKSLIEQVKLAMPQLGSRRDEVQVWLFDAQGVVNLNLQDGSPAVAAFRAAQALAAKMPEIFDTAARLRLRFREGEALIALAQYDAARDVFAEVKHGDSILFGPLGKDTLTAGVQHAYALCLSGDNQACVQEINGIYAQLVAVIGVSHSTSLLALSARAEALGRLGRYNESERDAKVLYDNAIASGGPQSRPAIDARVRLGDTQCRAGEVRAGLENSMNAMEAAKRLYGPTNQVTQAVATDVVLCMAIGGQYEAANALLRTLDRQSASLELDDQYLGETFDMLEAAVASGFGDMARARKLLIPLQQNFAKPGGDDYFRKWTEKLGSVSSR